MVGSSSSVDGEETGGILGRELPDSKSFRNKDMIFQNL